MNLTKTNIQTLSVFSRVISNNKTFAAKWLRGRYNTISMDDAEDIVQDSCVALWQWSECHPEKTLGENDMMNLWKAIIRNTCTHFLKKKSCLTSFDDASYNVCVSDADDAISQLKREMVYNFIDGMNDRDRTLITMTLNGCDSDDICKALGFKNKAVLKNIKCRTIQKMKRGLSQKMAA